MEAVHALEDKRAGSDVDSSELERTVDDGQQADHQTPAATEVSPWGRLVPVGGSTGRGSPQNATGLGVVELTPDQPPLLLGRSPDCDPRCRFGDKRISARHCRLYRERDASGHYVVVLEDLSSNGTFVNGTKVGKGKRRHLSSGDEIALTTIAVRGVPMEDRVCYLFQAVPPPPPRAAPAGDKEEEEEASTQEIIADEDHVTASTAHVHTPIATTTVTTTTVPAATATPAVAGAGAGGTDAGAGAGAGGGGGSPPSATATKRKKEDEQAGEREDDESERDKKKLRKLEETYEDNMVCGICQELLYKCVALFPCMHNFCACCYSEWRERGNSQCPQCRTHVQGLSKNHTICAIIESYIEANPEKARDPEELKEMDARSKLTDEMLRRVITYKGGKKAKSSYHDNDDECDDDDDEEEDEEEEDEDSEDDDRTYRPPLFATPFSTPLFGSTFSHYSGGYRTICRQCGTAGPDGFKCPSDGAAPHHLCSACGQPFPDRGDRCPTPIKCELCDKPYCDLYWGCASPVGVGKFKKLSQHTFTTLPPASFNNNPAEQEIVLNYLTAKGKSVTELWLACLADADSGAISFNGVHTRKNVQSGQHACWSCAQYAFQNLVYLHRANMPPEDLPTAVTSRPDCHWGRNCRTQQHNVGHAKRFNHVCEQTRF